MIIKSDFTLRIPTMCLIDLSPGVTESSFHHSGSSFGIVYILRIVISFVDLCFVYFDMFQQYPLFWPLSITNKYQVCILFSKQRSTKEQTLYKKVVNAEISSERLSYLGISVIIQKAVRPTKHALRNFSILNNYLEVFE